MDIKGLSALLAKIPGPGSKSQGRAISQKAIDIIEEYESATTPREKAEALAAFIEILKDG